MCGIVGLASRRPVPDNGWLDYARDAVAHRGPDDKGGWWSSDHDVGLGHRRLSIIDVSSAGHQPMQAADGSCHLVFNGEIYNFAELRHELASRGHRFNSQTDTEVILAAYREWGIECVERLNGMFALGLYDIPRRQIFLARDRAGEKPLFYAEAQGTLQFASELKSLVAEGGIRRIIDHEALDCYLSMGFVPGDRCIIAGVKKLPPGCALTYSLETGTTRVWSYWSLPESPNEGDEPATVDLVQELETLLEDAVRRQMVADVPVGILLSGGVDSSLITAMATRSRSRIQTFTVRFPGYGALDETEHARFIARNFGTEHTEMEAGTASPDLLRLLAWQFDEPVIDSSMIPTFLVSKLIRQHCTVALGGDGGDELFGGYQHYSRILWMEKTFSGIPLVLRRAIARAAERSLPVGFKGRNWLQALSVDFRTDVPSIASYFDARTRRTLLGDSWTGSAEEIRSRRVPKSADLLDRATRMDFSNYLAEDILVKVDRASMLSSLETRAPFLDYRLIEFAFRSVPPHLKADAYDRKIILKMLAAKILPAGFDANRKQGFSIPLASWLQSAEWRRFFRDVLLESPGVIFDRKAVERMLRGQDKGRANGERLFGLVMFELWRTQYGVAL